MKQIHTTAAAAVLLGVLLATTLWYVVGARAQEDDGGSVVEGVHGHWSTGRAPEYEVIGTAPNGVVVRMKEGTGGVWAPD